MPPARPRASPRASPAAARAATRRGIVKDGPYMTREASRRLKLAIAAAQRVLADGGSPAEAAAAVRKYTACASTTHSRHASFCLALGAAVWQASGRS